MNLGDWQARLRHFAAERDWQGFHTPKNFAMALLVEAAELAEIFQWMTPEESQRAREEPARRERIADELADVLLYLLQLADHCGIAVEPAVRAKFEKNARKHPARRAVAPPLLLLPPPPPPPPPPPQQQQQQQQQPGAAAIPIHVLLDNENVQPDAAELRRLVPEFTHLWVFHGPHQREVGKRFVSFGNSVTAVPISKPGKNALDFHLSFYMGYIASRNPRATMVVVANDKGYDPMLEHAGDLQFTVRRQPYGMAAASEPSPPPARTEAAASAAVNTAARQVAAEPDAVGPTTPEPAVQRQATEVLDAAGQPAALVVAADSAPARGTPVVPLPAPAKKVAQARMPVPTKKVAPIAKAVPSHQPKSPTQSKPAAQPKPATKPKPSTQPKPAQKPKAGPAVAVAAVPAAPAHKVTAMPRLAPDVAATIDKLSDNLRKMGDKRPAKPASLRRSLKSQLGASADDDAVEAALTNLVKRGVVRLVAASGVSYPRFDPP